MRAATLFRIRRKLHISGHLHEIVHVDLGADRLQVRRLSDGAVKDLILHVQFGLLLSGEIELYDEIGVQLCPVRSEGLEP
jgi:hypothetical protein